MNGPRLGRRARGDKSLIPEPPPLTGEEDQLLVASLRRWLNASHVGGNKRATAAIRRWMRAKGLD